MKTPILFAAFFLLALAGKAQVIDRNPTNPNKEAADTVYRDASSDPEKRLRKSREIEDQQNPTSPPPANDPVLKKQQKPNSTKSKADSTRNEANPTTPRPRGTAKPR